MQNEGYKKLQKAVQDFSNAETAQDAEIANEYDAAIQSAVQQLSKALAVKHSLEENGEE